MGGGETGKGKEGETGEGKEGNTKSLQNDKQVGRVTHVFREFSLYFLSS